MRNIKSAKTVQSFLVIHVAHISKQIGENKRIFTHMKLNETIVHC
jgi:hypothetical protein